MNRRKILCLRILLIIALIGVLCVIEKSRLYAAERSDIFEEEIVYQNRNYYYNYELLTFLVMGIFTEEDKEPLEGEADAEFLCVFNPGTKELSVIGLNRNSMVDIDFYNDEGIYLVRQKAQLTLQHGFGINKEQGSALQVAAVQRLMRGIPINGHVTVDMQVVEQMNHAVGGVSVTVLEDLTEIDETFVQGDEVCLSDEQAFWYVKYRNPFIYGTADRRLQRDIQFLQGFADKAIDKIHEDFMFPYHLYKECGEHVYTNISQDRIAMLLMLAKDCEVKDIRFYNLPGETKLGEKYEEFYVDEQQLLDMIVDIFYLEED